MLSFRYCNNVDTLRVQETHHLEQGTLRAMAPGMGDRRLALCTQAKLTVRILLPQRMLALAVRIPGIECRDSSGSS